MQNRKSSFLVCAMSLSLGDLFSRRSIKWNGLELTYLPLMHFQNKLCNYVAEVIKPANQVGRKCLLFSFFNYIFCLPSVFCWLISQNIYQNLVDYLCLKKMDLDPDFQEYMILLGFLNVVKLMLTNIGWLLKS